MVLDIAKKEKVKKIYGLLNRIIWQLEESEHYNYIPGTKEDGWDFFDMELSAVERAAQREFLGEPSILNRLEQIIKEVRFFVRSFSTPGVVERWREINPTINYFDAAYDFIREDPELYLRIERGEVRAKEELGGMLIHFSCHPTAKDLLEQKKYFETIERENQEQNNRFSESRIFQNEVVKTLGMVMQHDFPELCA